MLGIQFLDKTLELVGISTIVFQTAKWYFHKNLKYKRARRGRRTAQR